MNLIEYNVLLTKLVPHLRIPLNLITLGRQQIATFFTQVPLLDAVVVVVVVVVAIPLLL
jgi:hypothetical protein